MSIAWVLPRRRLTRRSGVSLVPSGLYETPFRIETERISIDLDDDCDISHMKEIVSHVCVCVVYACGVWIIVDVKTMCV